MQIQAYTTMALTHSLSFPPPFPSLKLYTHAHPLPHFYTFIQQKIVSQLLDVHSHPCKPQYEMASEEPVKLKWAMIIIL